MSTQTSLLKRIAQTAVVALLGGLMATVVTPAANAASNSSISGSCVARGGVGGVIAATYAGDSTTVIKAAQYSLTNVAGQTTTLDTSVSAVATDSSSSTFVLRLSADSVPATAATITYLIWSDRDGAGGTVADGIPAGDSFSAFVTCTIAGAPASISLSSTATSALANETVTVTATPKDASGNTTLLTSAESMTVKSYTTTAVRVNLQGGKPSNAAFTTFQNGAAAGVLSTTYADPTGALNVTQGTNSAQRSEGLGATTASATSPTASLSLSAQFADAAPGVVRSPKVIAYNGAAQAETPAFTVVSSESVTVNGGFSFNVAATGAATVTTVVAGSGSFPTAATATHTLTVSAATYGTSYGFGSAAASVAAGYGIIDNAEGWNAGAATIQAPTAAVPTGGLTDDATINVSTARTSIPLTINYTTGGSLSYTVAAVTGYPLPTGITAGTYTVTGASTDSITTVTFATTTPSSGQRFKVSFAQSFGATTDVTFVYQSPQVGSGIGSVVTTNDADTKKVLVTTGTVNSEITVRDQFGSLVSGATVLWTHSGRNNSAASTTATTDANGKSTYSYTDASTSTTSLTDTVQAQVTYGNSGSYNSDTTTFTFVTALTATTVTATAQDADGEIDADDTSASWVITVRGSSGEALTGFPVTVTGLSKTYMTSTTLYTGSTGTATVTVYGKTVGTESLTFTSGGVSATGTIDIVAGASRTYAIDKTSIDMSPGDAPVVTVTVKDGYGNLVEGQSVSVTYAGTAGGVASVNGVNSASGTSDANGEVKVTLGAASAGTGTLTVKSTMGNTSTALVTGDGSALPAKTAATGLTVAVSITGVSALQSSAESAADAALEAIDAANAATDAANLAAEAADAATVAAEEARDAADSATAAVEALASEVATLMAALKAQITTLAKTVAKIAKKVKA